MGEIVTGEMSSEFRICNMRYSDGKINCRDCGRVIGMGFEFYTVFQDGFKVGAAHTKDRSCEKRFGGS